MSQIEGESTRDRIYKGLSAQTLVTIVMGLLEIGVFAVMSRILTPEDFGYYAIIIAVTSLFQCLTEAGLGSAVIQNSNASQGYISTALALSVIIGVFFTILLFILAQPLSLLVGQGTTLITSFRWMSITLVLCSINSVTRAMFMRRLNFLKFGWCQVGAYIVSSAIGIIMAIKGYGVNAIIASTIANAVLMTIILFIVDGTYPSIKIERQYVKAIASYGGWLTGSVILRRITTEVDKLILTRWLPVASIGAYNRPSNFISRLQEQVIGIFDTVLFPILSSLNSDLGRLNRTFIKSVSLVSWFSTIFAAVFFICAEVLIEIFFGSDWLWLTDIFRILSVSIIFLSHSRIGDCYFRSLGWMKAYFNIRLIVCIFTIVCVYVGCHYDILGVAIGVVVSRVFDCIVKYGYLSLRMSIHPIDIIKAIVASSWLTFIVSGISYIIIMQMNYSEYFGILLFITIGISLLIFRPKWFGRDYYDNVYLAARAKLSRRG